MLDRRVPCWVRYQQLVFGLGSLSSGSVMPMTCLMAGEAEASSARACLCRVMWSGTPEGTSPQLQVPVLGCSWARACLLCSWASFWA